jgi:transposase-like protein
MMLVRERAGQAGNGAGRRRRRRVWSTEEKRRIVAESAAPGASVSVVARRHDINANMLFTWRRALGARLGVGSDPAAFVPAVMTAEEPASSPPASAHGSARSRWKTAARHWRQGGWRLCWGAAVA